jgi:uncharacterized membrane protein YphA (DoxX/SURF4 family)
MSLRNGKEVFSLVLRVGLGVLFTYSGGMKLFGTGLDVFIKDIGNFHLVSEPYDAVLAYTLPWLELLVGLFLLLGFYVKASVMWALLMSIIFVIAISSAWVRGIDLYCGCFGKSTEAVNYPFKMIALLIQLTCCGYVLYREIKRKDSLQPIKSRVIY